MTNFFLKKHSFTFIFCIFNYISIFRLHKTTSFTVKRIRMNKSTAVKRFFFRTNRHHCVLLCSQLLCLGVFLFLELYTNVSIRISKLSSVFPYVVFGLVAFSVITGHFIYKKGIQQAHLSKSLDKKLSRYHNCTIKQWAVLEITFITTLFTYMISGHLLLIGTVAVIFLIFVAILPTPLRVALDLHLKGEDKSLIYSRGREKEQTITA